MPNVFTRTTVDSQRKRIVLNRSPPVPITKTLQLRWLIRKDMEQILKIENECFDSPYDIDWFMENLRHRNVVGMVADIRGSIAGFMLYELHKTHISIFDFAVSQEYQRQGVGTSMVQRLVDKLSHQGREAIEVMTSDQNINAHLFFRSCGFKAMSVFRDHFESDGGEFADGYLFQYRI
jgi:ribosomal-protein-alanine N-acetyltransferase